MDSRTDNAVLVRDWLLQWVDGKVRRANKLATQERYQNIIELKIIPALGSVPLTELRPRQVDAMLGGLLDSGLAPATVRAIHTVLSAACKEAVKLEMIDHNPVAAVSPPPKRRTPVVLPEARVVGALLRLAQEEGDPLFPFLHLLTYTGMRRGEALALRWGNVNLAQGFLSVVESAVKTRTQGLVLEKPKSANGTRIIDLDRLTIELLAEHLETQIRAGLFDGDEPPPDALVFRARDGGLLKVTNIQRGLKRLGQRVGWSGITFHSLRHFHATLALQQRQNPVVVSRRLGHASVTTTLDTYGHSMPGWQQGTAEAFARAMEYSRPE